MKLHHRIHAHIKKHHKKYLLGTGLAGAGFFAVKALIFALGFLGILNHGGTFAAYDPSICNGVTDVPVTECEALIDFYNATDGDNWSDNSNWGNTGSICNRYGVLCDANHVIRLSVGSNNIVGDVPSSIANLTQLQMLGLGNNQITSLPSTIGSLSYLDDLAIQNNSISSLPDSIGELSQLTTLSMTRNNLSSLPDTFANLHITAVDLGYNQFTTIPNIIFSMTGLTVLGFQDNAITEIPAAISNLQQLTFLSARNNLLTSLPESLLLITTLQSASLDGNAICGLSGSLLTLVNNLGGLGTQSCTPPFSCNIADIPSTECEALVTLYMNTNGTNRNNATNWLATGNICGNWYGITCNTNHITQIDLSNNNLSGTVELTGGLDELAIINLGNNWLNTISITNIPSLQNLFLNNNKLESVDLAGLVGLGYLNLYDNLLTTLSEDIMDMTLLTDAFGLNIYLNHINYHNFSQALLNFIDNKHSIQLGNWRFYQDLCGNGTIEGAEICDDGVNNGTPGMCNATCDGEVATSMCDDIPQSECDALINLYNDTNGDNRDYSGRLVTGTVCDNRYGVSCTDNHVTTINLDDNNLSGSADFSALTGLVELHLGNKVGNNLTSIDVSGLTNLTTLHVMHNDLASINLDGLTNLTDVNLGWNNLSTISLAGLTNLDALRLGSNQLSNVDLSDLLALTKLYLSDNQLSSIDISNSSNLDTLILYNNLLSKLPESTMGLTNLANVNLNNSCRDTGSMSTDLVTFLDTKVGNSDRQIVTNPSCSALPPEEPQASTGVCDQVTDVSTGECLALIDFYNSTNGANRTTGTNRGTTGTVCRSGDAQEGRYGVECSCNRFDANCESTTGGTVKRLDLQGNNLSGSIPSSLTGLGGLRWLSLGYNNITSLPDNIGDFTNLVGLSVYNNQISTLPASLYTMTQLTHLEINNNNIVNIAEDISNLTSLQNFHLGNNPLDHIPDNLWTMTGIRTLRLTNLGITDIPEALWDFQYLTDLQLDENEISLLSGGIGKLTQLRYVYLNDNLLTSLPDEFFDLGNLQDVYLDHNTIEGTMDPFCRTGASAKGITHGNFERVRNFNISHNRFSGKIPECLISADQLDSPVGNIFDLGQHRYNGGTNGLAYNYLDIDNLSSELTDYLDTHFLDTKNHIEDRTRQYRSSDLSVSGFILSSREHPRLGDPITLEINYANDGPVKIISGKVYVDVVSGIVITGYSTFDYITGMIGSIYGEVGDPCFDDLYTGSTGAYRTLFETIIAGQMEGATIMQRLQNTFGYTGTQVGAGKFLVDTLLEQGGQLFGDISFSDMMYAFAGIDLATIPNCGTPGKPVYVFDIGDIDVDATGMILLSGFIVPNFSGTTIENPISIRSTYDLRVDTNTGNNEKNISKQLSTDKIVTLPSLPDLKYTHDAFEYRGYIVPGNKSIINDTQESTLIGTSAIDFTNTSRLRIPIIITSPEENIQAYIASGTNTEFSGTACESVLLAPEEYPTSVASGVFGSGYTVKKVFKIGSSCTGSSMIFDQDVEIGVQLDTVKTGYVIKSSSDGSSRDEVPAGKNSVSPNGIVISFTTRHFSYFAIAEPVDGEVIVPPITIRYGGGITLRKDNCPNGDFSPSFYDSICGTKPTTTHSSADTCDGATEELVGAYDFAFAHNITTQPTCARAKLENTIRRKEMAKMISVFAINIMGMTPNTGKNCSFTDLSHETGEMNVFAKLVCQLGLMGYETDGVTQKDEFEPNVLVDRGQFGTILSRILRGTTYAGGKPYYVKHLAALKKANIMTKIDTPRVLELRGRVLLTMQRVFEMKK